MALRWEMSPGCTISFLIGVSFAVLTSPPCPISCTRHVSCSPAEYPAALGLRNFSLRNFSPLSTSFHHHYCCQHYFLPRLGDVRLQAGLCMLPNRRQALFLVAHAGILPQVWSRSNHSHRSKGCVSAAEHTRPEGCALWASSSHNF